MLYDIIRDKIHKKKEKKTSSRELDFERIARAKNQTNVDSNRNIWGQV